MIGDSPVGGKWTFDDENRKKYPKGKVPPVTTFPKEDKKYCDEANNYVKKYFNENYGVLESTFKYPTCFSSSKKCVACRATGQLVTSIKYVLEPVARKCSKS